jgi:flagellar protein FlaF
VNAIEQARQAYGPRQHHIRTPRAIEVQAIQDITARLRRPDQDFPSLVNAVQDNRRLWNILAMDVASANNSLPQGLRAQIFYLAEFTNQHSSKILKREADTSALVEINLAVLRGLTATPGRSQ